MYVGNWKNNFVNNKVGILFASVTRSMSLRLSVTFVNQLEGDCALVVDVMGGVCR